jgi:hypothetical protein
MADKEGTGAVVHRFFKDTENPLAGLDARTTELKTLQEQTLSDMSQEQTQFQECQRGLLPLSYTFEKLPRYLQKVQHMKRQMASIETRVTRLKTQSATLAREVGVRKP